MVFKRISDKAVRGAGQEGLEKSVKEAQWKRAFGDPRIVHALCSAKRKIFHVVESV